MGIRDEIKKERKAYFKQATTKEKIKYIQDYYGLRIFILLIVLLIIGMIIYNACTKPTGILNGTFVNMSIYNMDDDPNELGDAFLKAEKMDTSDYETSFVSNLSILNSEGTEAYEMHQMLFTQMSAGALDFLVATPELLLTYAYDESFTDLSTVLTKEQMEQYKPYFLYVDGELVEKRANPDVSLEELSAMTFPDCRKPEEMKQPIPVMVDLTESEKVQKLYNKKASDLCYAVIYTGANQEYALKFLNYIMK